MIGVAITLRVCGDGIASLDWIRAGAAVSADDGDALRRALTAAADDAFAAGGLRRLEVVVPADDRLARRAALRSGFRLEGIQREALRMPDGALADRCLYARLVSDQVAGTVGFSAVMNSALPRKRVIAHVLIRDPEGRVLLCETRFKPDWELPGGIVEPFEPPRVAAARELTEELGVRRPVGRLLVADWMPPYLGWDDALELIFDGGLISESDLAGLQLQPTEIVRVALCTLDEARDLLTPLSHRRLTIAASLTPGEFAYLEDGAITSGNDPTQPRRSP